MNNNQVRAIQASFERLQASGSDYSTDFYKRVFELAPQTITLFKDDLTEQKKALHATLALVVNGLNKFNQLESAIYDLGQRHVQYGVQPEHFPIVARALLDTLNTHVSEFTDAEREAWEAGLTAITDIMMRAWNGRQMTG